MKENGATSGSLERTSTLAADVLLTFFILENLSRELDMGSEFAKQFRVDSPMSMSVIQLVTDAHTNNQQEAPGVSLLTALTALLSSGKAHVISGDDPSRAPIEGTEQSEAMTNHRLGWVAGGPDGSLRSAGESIGTVVTVKRQKVVLFDKVTAFDAARKAYPSLVKHGQGPSAAWSGIWDEGLAADVKRPFKSTTGTPLNVYGYKTKTGTRFEGIPVAVSRLLDRGPLPQELTQEEGQD
jgi:hypothetical protein